jgi:hypothetical protein
MKLDLRRSAETETDRTEELDEKAKSADAPAVGSHVCPVCGETVKAGDFGASLYHQRPNHKASDRRH